MSRQLTALQKDLPYDFSMLETSLMNLIVLYAGILLYSLQMAFQFHNSPVSRETKVMTHILKMEEESL